MENYYFHQLFVVHRLGLHSLFPRFPKWCVGLIMLNPHLLNGSWLHYNTCTLSSFYAADIHAIYKNNYVHMQFHTRKPCNQDNNGKEKI